MTIARTSNTSAPGPVRTRARGERPAGRFCHSIPAIVGPWRGQLRAWHAPPASHRALKSCPGMPERAYDAASAAVDGSGATRITSLFDDVAPICQAQAIARLRRALRRERQLGLAGHFAYDFARHAELRRRLDAVTSASTRRHGLGEPRFGVELVVPPTRH